ncbi:two-component system sensor histidine kinase YesM [Aequitasia blattaphilus]|uniref:histidine kinase n=1 Tax=Aequitasia blattaphilus TaxID=2949332 RepID=A0ABT1EAH4_9FIRM|nr:histidine kinase [Aequitasia blattaphilus]MCP1102841.1 histidine kinase [Aequitasia blattaphilus]MCR8615481.1 histidine kinase [Aequitasia blattaphilus]
MKNKKKTNSIGGKLIRVFLVVFVMVFLINAFIYLNLNKAIGQIDTVYSSNIQLNDLSECLKDTKGQLYQYLNTKGSDSLESYYANEQEYREQLKLLTKEATANANTLAEKNVYNMSLSYLELTSEAISAKRGRDVTKYREAYEESNRIYDYIQSNINSINTTVFLQNAHNYEVLRAILGYTMIFSIIVLGIVFLLGIIWTASMTRNITKPLVELANVATEIAKGNMEVDFPIVETGDEITAVAKACNKMMDSIRSHIEETKENLRRESELKENELLIKNDLKEAQLRYLQAQINPHFLFNSLNAGAQLAMMEGAEKACLFIEHMADFFRYNVRKMGKSTTLLEEVNLIDHYIYILNVRFSGEIIYNKQVDERFLDIEMPGMILQPIVENAVNHGIKEIEREGRIDLGIYSDQEKVCISITDNGVGIKKETIEKILTGVPDAGENEKDSTGIGLNNVINRLRSYYNEKDIMDIQSLDEGTKVVIYLPKGSREL